MDNLFIERLWRSLKHEDVHLRAYADGREAKSGIAAWIAFYDTQRFHQALANRPPMLVWCEAMAAAAASGAGVVEMMDNAAALTHPHSGSRERPLWLLKRRADERAISHQQTGFRGPAHGIHFTLCQRCPMIHDRPEHQRRRLMTLHSREALGDPFAGPYI